MKLVWWCIKVLDAGQEIFKRSDPNAAHCWALQEISRFKLCNIDFFEILDLKTFASIMKYLLLHLNASKFIASRLDQDTRATVCRLLLSISDDKMLINDSSILCLDQSAATKVHWLLQYFLLKTKIRRGVDAILYAIMNRKRRSHESETYFSRNVRYGL